MNDVNPLEYPDQPDRYELYEVDEDDSDIEIEYDMGPRTLDDPIGEFPKLAFVLNKRFKNSEDDAARESAEMSDAL